MWDAQSEFILRSIIQKSPEKAGGGGGSTFIAEKPDKHHSQGVKVNLTSANMSIAGTPDVTRWEGHFTSVVIFPQELHNPNLIMGKTSDKPQLKDSLQKIPNGY